MSLAILARKNESAKSSKAAPPSMTAASGLKIGAANSDLEQEADRVADEIMATGAPRLHWSLAKMSIAPPVQRKCACGRSGHCETCGAGQTLLRKSDGAARASHAPSIVHDVLRSPGRQLDRAARDFFEPRFGHDFGSVRVHSDARAAESARAVGALAYTVGEQIVFGEGQFLESFAARRLLAHELVHTLQPCNGFVRRVPDPAVLGEFDTKAAAIKAMDTYKTLPPAAKAVADEIMTKARASDQAIYYIDNLHVLFTTPYDDPAQTGAANTAAAQSEVADEKTRVAAEGEDARLSEERASTAARSRFKKRKGQDGKTFLVDATDPNNIVVQVKIHLTKSGKGKDTDVADVKSLEDAIEKHASVPGYTVDVVFVLRGGLPDVFEVAVDPGKFTDSGNFRADSALALAHEVHHLLGLDDRYNYIEHSHNREMKIPDRLGWFREQINRDAAGQADPHASESIMGSGQHPLDDDICKVSGLDMATCQAARRWGF
jgi:hypothetical protein